MLSLVEAPDTAAITVTQVREQIKQEGVTVDDSYLESSVIPAVIERAETVTRRQLITATWDWKLDGFPDCSVIWLPLPPLQEVVSISYVDPNGETQVWSSSNYSVDAPSGPHAARGRIELGYGLAWPLTRAQINAVTIRFEAGYGDDGDTIPALIRMGMLIDAATLYLNRDNPETVPPPAIYRSFKAH